MSYLIVGAGSDTAIATIDQLLSLGESCLLTVRDIETLKASNQWKHWQELYPKQLIGIVHYDIQNDQPESLLHVLPDPLTGVICFIGSLVPQEVAEENNTITERELFINYTGIVLLFNVLSKKFISQGHGIMACVGSVAGDRGRPSNYIYGSAKAGLATYLEGLQASLFKKNIHICIIKPGFIRTKMLNNRDVPEILVASPKTIARDIISGIQNNKPCIYTPWFWRWIMLIFKWIPTNIFLRVRT